MSGAVAGLVSAAIAGFAMLLAAIMAGALPARPRAYLRFATALGGALVLADGAASILGGDDVQIFAGAVTLLVAALAPPALVLAALRRVEGALMPTLALVAACLAGLIAAMTGSALYAFTPLALAVAVLGAMAMRAPQRAGLLLGLGAGALVAGAAAMSGGGRTGFVLFYAVGQLGIVLALLRRSDMPVERQGRARPRTVVIGRES